MEKKYNGKWNNTILDDDRWVYNINRRNQEQEHDLLHANRAYLACKADLVLHELSQKEGKDTLDAALREFHRQWAYKSSGPYAGTKDLFGALQRHTPDSLQNYLMDSWTMVH